MSLDPTAEVDAEIARVERANRGAFSLLMQLENHPGLAALAAGQPTGLTGRWWQQAQRGLSLLWCLFRQHSTGLTAQRTIRARDRVLAAGDMDTVFAISDGIVGPTAPRPMSDVIQEIIGVHDELRSGVDAVERVRAELAGGIDECAAHLATAAERSVGLGAEPQARLAGLTARLDLLHRGALGDPLSRWTGTAVERHEADQLAADCARFASQLAALDEMRAQAPALLAGLDGTLRQLEGPLEQAYRRAGQLVADPEVDLGVARAAVESYRHLVNGTAPAAGAPAEEESPIHDRV